LTLIQYKEHRFRKSVLGVINQANTILAEMGAMGYTLTLRQLFYQFVRRNWIENTERNYKRLGRVVTDAREAGLMSWTAIEDRGRNCEINAYTEDPSEVLNGIEFGLNVDRWAKMDDYVEVWVEKQALESVIAKPCRKWHTPFMACKGYLSASEAWRAGLRFQQARQQGKRPVLIHLGDHDPSGIDMTRDNGDRLELYSRQGVEVRRIALNMDQIEQYDPPPNPVKGSDSRWRKYAEEHGNNSWELDALEPKVLDDLIQDAITTHIDMDKWDEAVREEDEKRADLAKLHERWPELQRLVNIEGKPLERLRMYDFAVDHGQSLNTLEFLDWIAGRLVEVYGESENVDFVLSLKERANLLRNARVGP
jgi:hypothetical protein